MKPNNKQRSPVTILRIMFFAGVRKFPGVKSEVPSIWFNKYKCSVNICCMNKLKGRGTQLERAQVMAESGSALKSIFALCFELNCVKGWGGRCGWKLRISEAGQLGSVLRSGFSSWHWLDDHGQVAKRLCASVCSSVNGANKSLSWGYYEDYGRLVCEAFGTGSGP